MIEATLLICIQNAHAQDSSNNIEDKRTKKQKQEAQQRIQAAISKTLTDLVYRISKESPNAFTQLLQWRNILKQNSLLPSVRSTIEFLLLNVDISENLRQDLLLSLSTVLIQLNPRPTDPENILPDANGQQPHLGISPIINSDLDDTRQLEMILKTSRYIPQRM